MKKEKTIIKTEHTGVNAFFISKDIDKTKDNINKMLRDKLLKAYKELKGGN